MTHERRQQLKREFQNLGRRALRAWRQSGGSSPKIDDLFKQMDAINDQLGCVKARRRPTAA